MAQRTIVQLVSDLSGEDIEDGGRTVEFSIDGAAYQLDLTDQEAADFEAAFQPYIDVASRVGGSSGRRSSGRGSRRGRSRNGSGRDTKTIREWANANGYKVGDRGRIPSEIIEAFEAAN